MKQYRNLSLLILAFLLITCKKTENFSIDKTTNDDINYFIWKGLNALYLWQDDVPDLADNRFANFDELYLYFRNFESPEEVFQNLRFQPGIVDRFSFIVDDYVALENSLMGINVSNGMEFGLVRYLDTPTQVFGYVRYVVPGSDAASKGVTRGMLFNTVDGTQLTESNFSNLLFGSSVNYTIGLSDFNNGNPSPNGNSIILNKSELQENPIAIAKTFKENNTSIGYLLYNGFSRSFDEQLNAAFANFKAENINDLVIDLRYNSGGSTSTATYLASMITGQFNDQVFSKEIWNDKVMSALPASNFVNNFTNQIRNVDSNGTVILQENINSLNLNRVYFIVKNSTASASELLINSLGSYIDVYLIGTQTVGKQVGSATLYDSDNLRKTGDNLNPNHKYALQPLIFEISNKDNVNHPNGLIPGTTFPGVQLAEDYNNLGVLGERSDPLLDRTLVYIVTGAKSPVKENQPIGAEEIFDSKLANPVSNNMYTSNKIKEH